MGETARKTPQNDAESPPRPGTTSSAARGPTSPPGAARGPTWTGLAYDDEHGIVTLTFDAPKPRPPLEMRTVYGRPTNVPKLRPKVEIPLEQAAEILGSIVQGAYPQVAVRAITGMTAKLYHEMMNLRTPDAIDFQNRIRQAEAQARQGVEHRIASEYPLVWAQKGPGRDRGDAKDPGWVDKIDVNVTGKVLHGHLFQGAGQVDDADALQTIADALAYLDDDDISDLERVIGKIDARAALPAHETEAIDVLAEPA